MKITLLVAIPAAIILLILKFVRQSGTKRIVIALLLSFASSILLEVVQSIMTGKPVFYYPLSPIGVATHGAFVFAVTITLVKLTDFFKKRQT